MKGEHKCCNKVEVKKGPWSAEEDKRLCNYVTYHDQFRWSSVPELTGLKRCGKSCRLRWLNYLQPDLKHGNFSEEEIDLIYRVQKKIGNKWADIARLLPGRTDNEIKNFWNSKIKKRPLDNQCHELSSSTRQHKFSTSVAIYPISILESSNQPNRFRTSTNFNRSVNTDSSKFLTKKLHNSTTGSGSFQQNNVMKIHSSSDHNLNQRSPLNQLYTIPSSSCLMSIVNHKNKGCHNGHSLQVGDVPPPPNALASSKCLNVCPIPRFGPLSAIPSDIHEQVTSPILRTSYISNCGGKSSNQLKDHQPFPFLMSNTSAIPNNGRVGLSLSNTHVYSTSHICTTYSTHICESIQSKYSNGHCPLMPSLFNQSSIANASSRMRHGWINSNGSNDDDLFPSSMFNMSPISQSEWINPSSFNDPNKIASPMLNTSPMSPSRWMSSSLIYNHDQISSPMFISTCERMNSSPLSNAQSYPSCSKDQTNSSNDPISIDINDFFNFDVFGDNSMKASHDCASSEVHAKSPDIDMTTNTYAI